MKQVNFITALTPQQQYEIKRWFMLSAFLITCSLIGLILYITPQLYSLYTTHQEIKKLQKTTSNYNNTTTEHAKLKKENEELQKKQMKRDAYQNNPKNPHPYCAAIINACANGTILEYVRKNKKECEIALICPTTTDATNFVNKLAESNLFKNSKLTSLQQEGQTKKFRCIIKAQLV